MSAHDIIEYPPHVHDGPRERIRELLTREPMGDPRSVPFDPRDDDRSGFLIVGVLFAAIVFGTLAGWL